MCGVASSGEVVRGAWPGVAGRGGGGGGESGGGGGGTTMCTEESDWRAEQLDKGA